MSLDESDADGRRGVEYDFVPNTLAHAVRSVEEADGYLHIGEDDAYAPLGGFWIPTSDEIAEVDYPPKGELIRYPDDPDRGPTVVGEDEVPMWVET